MPIPLLIPWFKLEPWAIPFPIIDELKIQPFGVLVAIGILLGSRVAEWRGERTGVPPRLVADFLVYTIVIGLIACYFLNAALYKPETFVAILRDPSQLFKQYLGLSSFGGFVGGVAAALWFRHKKQASLLVLGDIFCYAFPFAWFFGRSGCFVVHDHPGAVSDFFLAVDNYNLGGQPRHDLGLYEVIWSAFAIAIVLWLGRKPRPWGFFVALIPLLYAPVRFFLDYLRAEPELGGDVRYFGLTPGQYGALAMIVVGLVVLWRVRTGPQPSVYLDGRPVTMDDAPAQASSPARSKGRTSKKQRKR